MAKKKMTSYFIILLSLLFVSFSLKYGLPNFSKSIPLSVEESSNKERKSKHKNSSISIQNGCGKNGLGLSYKKYLLNNGYDITQFIDASHFGHTSTKIYFHKNNKKSALHLANHLGIESKKIHEETNLDYYHDLTLILGQDYNILKSHQEVERYNPFK